ncbi:hypothetical protein [Kistimonas asteriae]|uniref:hypothetical protein n=1 Tax=Kistimonas asteriae TaxID=517724 RepID=UPI001BAC8C65|nr:hypothetical protein [Kistimonas asteriae]
MGVVTEARIRSEYRKAAFTTFEVELKDIITPSARQFIQDKGIALVIRGQDDVTPVEESLIPATVDEGDNSAAAPTPHFICDYTGGMFTEKPDCMAVLGDNRLVLLTDPRIALQEQFDRLQADMLCMQVDCAESGRKSLCDELQKVLDYVRQLTIAIVPGENVDPDVFRTQDSEPAPLSDCEDGLPHYSMGRTLVSLNRLRAGIREAELTAVHAYQRGQRCERPDMLRALHHLSGHCYQLMVRERAGEFAPAQPQSR